MLTLIDVQLRNGPAATDAGESGPQPASSAPMAPTLPASFRRVIAAEVVSNFGAMMSRLAIPWLAVLMLAATPWQMALLAIADVMAGAAAALALGVAVDRLPKRRTMVAADIARMALLGLLAWATVAGQISFGLLLLAAALTGILGIAFELARSAWIAQAARADELSRRNAQLAAGGAVSEAAAFAITGFVFQWIGAAAALWLDALSYLVSALLLRRVAEPAHPPRLARGPAGTDVLPAPTLRDALVLLARHRVLRTLAGLDMLLALAMGTAGTSYMIYVTRELALSTSVLGLIFALGGAGSALGAALAPRCGRRAGSGRALAWGLCAGALGSAFVPLASDAGLTAIALLAAHQVLGDAGLLMAGVHDRTLRQTLVPSAALARVDGAMRTLGQTATVAGALGGGALATAYGARLGLWASTALLCVAAVLALAAFRRIEPAASRAIV